MTRDEYLALAAIIESLNQAKLKLEKQLEPFLLEYDASDDEKESLSWFGIPFLKGEISRIAFIKHVKADLSMPLYRAYKLVECWIKAQNLYSKEGANNHHCCEYHKQGGNPDSSYCSCCPPA